MMAKELTSDCNDAKRMGVQIWENHEQPQLTLEVVFSESKLFKLQIDKVVHQLIYYIMLQ